MNGKVDIFGIKFNNLTTSETAELVLEKTRAGEGLKPITVFTPNPEIVMAAQKDSELMAVINAADIISADGVGIVWASKYFGLKIKERASGYDIVQELFKKGAAVGLSTFFFGGGEDEVKTAAVNMEALHPGLMVKGVINGYYKDAETPEILKRINAEKADVLLVGLGSPKQEKWVRENLDRLNVKAMIVVGGSFDVMSGKLKRAPLWLRKLGLEWLYRLLTQPRRIKRMIKLPLFVIKVLVYNVGKHKKRTI